MKRNLNDQDYLDSIHRVAKKTEDWPSWKKEGWAILDKREETKTYSSASKETPNHNVDDFANKSYHS